LRRTEIHGSDVDRQAAPDAPAQLSPSAAISLAGFEDAGSAIVRSITRVEKGPSGGSSKRSSTIRVPILSSGACRVSCHARSRASASRPASACREASSPLLYRAAVTSPAQPDT